MNTNEINLLQLLQTADTVMCTEICNLRISIINHLKVIERNIKVNIFAKYLMLPH